MMNKRESSTIVRQLQVVFAISITILVATSLASYYSSKKLVETSQWVNHTNEVLLGAERLISTVTDAETGQRGYIITRDSIFLQHYLHAHEDATKICEQLKRITADNPDQQHRVNRAKIRMDERFLRMDRVLRLIAAASSDEARIKLLQKDKEDMLRGKQIMDELRDLVEQMKNDEKNLLSLRLAQQSLYRRYTPLLVIMASLVSVLITLLAYFRIKRDIAARAQKQKEDEETYIDTRRRIGLMEDVTRQIASGDYTVRSKENGSDDLGRIGTALNAMASSLERNFTALEAQNWQQKGTVIVSDTIRGERNVGRLANRLVDAIARYAGAQVGTLYTEDENEQYKLSGKYAADNAPLAIQARQGLTGQAIASEELIATEALPAEFVKISSSLGHTMPVYAVIVPFLHYGKVVGVMELGFVHKPSERTLEFLKINAEKVAIGLNAARIFERMQELLEETQAQAEELQAQHSELENINAELEVQTEKLQASEEELRVQQEELQQANEELEERSKTLEDRNHQILQKTLEVQRNADELEKSTKYKSEFLANMSHELRTPLNSILLLSRLLSENTPKNLNDDQVEYARVIQSSGNGLLALIDEILDLSKIEAGKMKLEYERTQVTSVTDNMRALFGPIAMDKKVGLNITVADDAAVEIETDRLRLEQVLKNLLSNALKFTQEGSVTLNVTRNAQKPNFLDFAVTDTGIGIPEEKQHLIFEAFQQADGSTRRKFGGTGLGLSISKELARMLGGNISLASTPNEGSTFTLSVPIMRKDVPQEQVENSAGSPAVVAEEEAQEITTSPELENIFVAAEIPKSLPDDRDQVKPGDKSILIVEDDTNFAKALLDFTRKRGYKGIVSVRGDEGITLAKRYHPMGVLLDITLPVKSGWQVMEELKRDPQTRPIPVHMMSSHSMKRESMAKGAIDFINKPVAFEQMHDVFAKLEHVLNRTTRKVLIVEENPRHAKALAYFLESFDIVADVKGSVQDSVDALMKDTDCVILDMGVPDAKAYETLEEIKQKPGLENLPIIIFTGKSLSMTDEARIKQYADSIVVKTAHSYRRILDEVSLFLHLVEQGKKEDGDGDKKLGALNDVLKDKTVLIVDDDVRNIFSLTRALETAQMKIITAIDGKEAMHRLDENKNIDVVLLDMMMPQMDGYETARAIRKEPRLKRLPVIAVTAKAMAGDREKCIEAGASDYITKPVDMDQLLSLLRVWLYDKA